MLPAPTPVGGLTSNTALGMGRPVVWSALPLTASSCQQLWPSRPEPFLSTSIPAATSSFLSEQDPRRCSHEGKRPRRERYDYIRFGPADSLTLSQNRGRTR